MVAAMIKGLILVLLVLWLLASLRHLSTDVNINGRIGAALLLGRGVKTILFAFN